MTTLWAQLFVSLALSTLMLMLLLFSKRCLEMLVLVTLDVMDGSLVTVTVVAIMYIHHGLLSEVPFVASLLFKIWIRSKPLLSKSTWYLLP